MLDWLARNWMWLVGLWLVWRVTYLLDEVRTGVAQLREEVRVLSNHAQTFSPPEVRRDPWGGAP